MPVGGPADEQAVVVEAQLGRVDVERDGGRLQQPLAAAGVPAERARAVVAQPREGELPAQAVGPRERDRPAVDRDVAGRGCEGLGHHMTGSWPGGREGVNLENSW